MSDQINRAEPPAPTHGASAPGAGDDRLNGGGTLMTHEEAYAQLRERVANPDDPPVRRPPSDARGPRPGPDFRGAPGRVAIVQGQVYLVGIVVIAQLFLITTALYELLSGQTALLWWIALASLVGFLVALLIALWPRSRVKNY